jgi:hypothetical protein
VANLLPLTPNSGNQLNIPFVVGCFGIVLSLFTDHKPIVGWHFLLGSNRLLLLRASIHKGQKAHRGSRNHFSPLLIVVSCHDSVLFGHAADRRPLRLGCTHAKIVRTGLPLIYDGTRNSTVLLLRAPQSTACSVFTWLIRHHLAVFFSQNKPAISNQSAVFFSHKSNSKRLAKMT